MTGTTSVRVLADPAAVASAAAALLVERIRVAQTARGHAHVVLTGGGVGTGTLKALADDAGSVDWSRVDLWWGDERFLPGGDPERNETQARQAFLDRIDIDSARVHPIPGSDGPDGDDPDAAAERYAQELLAGGGGQVPAFDVLMLGVGPEGHVASIFPDSPAARADGVATAVRDCPKPPPTRVSLTFSALCRAREVWFLTAGAEKAEAVGRAFRGATALELPAAGVQGTEATVWWLDTASATELPDAPGAP